MTSAEFEYHGTDEDKEILRNKIKFKISLKIKPEEKWRFRGNLSLGSILMRLNRLVYRDRL